MLRLMSGTPVIMDVTLCVCACVYVCERDRERENAVSRSCAVWMMSATCQDVASFMSGAQ